MIIDLKKCFHSQISELRLKLGRHCSIAARVRHCLPEDAFVRYYHSNIESLLQYVLLVYRCCSLNPFSEVLINQLEIEQVVFFQEFREICEALFVKNQILTVFELFIGELLKFVFLSLSSMHAESYLKKLFSYARTSRSLEHSNDSDFVVPMASYRFQKYSLKSRVAKLLNLLVCNRNKVGEISLNSNQFKKLVYRWKNVFVLGNSELVSDIFYC